MAVFEANTPTGISLYPSPRGTKPRENKVVIPPEEYTASILEAIGDIKPEEVLAVEVRGGLWRHNSQSELDRYGIIGVYTTELPKPWGQWHMDWYDINEQGGVKHTPYRYRNIFDGLDGFTMSTPAALPPRSPDLLGSNFSYKKPVSHTLTPDKTDFQNLVTYFNIFGIEGNVTLEPTEEDEVEPVLRYTEIKNKLILNLHFTSSHPLGDSLFGGINAVPGLSGPAITFPGDRFKLDNL